MAEMTNGLHIKLEKYRRGTDLGLYQWFFGMYDTEEDVRELVVRESAKIPGCLRRDEGPLGALCVSQPQDAHQCQAERAACA